MTGGRPGAPNRVRERLHMFRTDKIAKRREATGFRTSVIFKQVQQAVPERLPD